MNPWMKPIALVLLLCAAIWGVKAWEARLIARGDAQGAARVQTAWAAGCDMLLVCNSPESVALVLDNWQPESDSRRSERIARLLPAESFAYPDPHVYREALGTVLAVTSA